MSGGGGGGGFCLCLGEILFGALERPQVAFQRSSQVGKRQTPLHHLKLEQAPDLDFPAGNTWMMAFGRKVSSVSHVNKIRKEVECNNYLIIY